MTPEILSTTNLRFLELKNLKIIFSQRRKEREGSIFFCELRVFARGKRNKIREIGEDALTNLIYSLITFFVIVLSPIVIRK